MQSGQIRLMCLSVLVSSAFAMGARATEGGSNQYPLGVNSVLPALLPAPGGTEYFNYLQYYTAGVLAGPNGAKQVPGFHANITAEVARIVHSWPVQIGPFGLSSGIVQPIVNASIRLPFTAQSQDRLGFGNTVLQPVLLTYSNPSHTFFSYFGSNIWAPDGAFSPGHAVNTGLNHWSFGPDFAITWLATPRVQFSLQGITEFNAQNNANKYKGGTAVSFDYGVDFQPLPSLLPKFHVGVSGYAYQQITDDTVNGAVFRNGNRGRVIAVGPQFRYDWKMGGIVAKWEKELAVENRTAGDRFWVQFAVPIF